MAENRPTTVEDTAIEWFVRLRDDEVSDAERAAFQAWLAADPAHAAAHWEIERLWAGLDQVGPQARGAADAKGDPPYPANQAASGVSRTGSRRRSRASLAAAASILVAIVLGGYLFNNPSLFADYRTAAGERRTVTLADGSTAQLNTASALSSAFTDKRRQVTLHAGEAYFQVAAHPDRPFVVNAGRARITALGTAFSVTRTEEAVEVIVTEHRVGVAAPGHGRAIFAAGKGVRLTADGFQPLDALNINRALAWRQGRVVFENAPLSTVLTELDRYRPGRIVIRDEAAQDIPVTGAFDITDSDKALTAVDQSLPVRMTHLTGWLVLVYAE